MYGSVKVWQEQLHYLRGRRGAEDPNPMFLKSAFIRVPPATSIPTA